MSQTLVSASDVGRPCPYCRFPLKQDSSAERCDSCGSLHHEDCWRDGGGCSTFGCPGVGTAQHVTAGGAQQASWTPNQGVAPAAQPYPHGYQAIPAQIGVPRSNNRQILLVSTIVAVLGLGTGALVASGAFSGKSTVQTPPSITQSSQAAVSTPSSAQPPSNVRNAIMGLLSTYQRSYSQHDVDGLSQIFSPHILRHGLTAAGCVVSHGRDAVLADYASQFAEGSGSYELVGLTPEDIQIDGSTSAHLHAHYIISPGGTGYVNFNFAELGEGWKINEVYATCA